MFHLIITEFLQVNIFDVIWTNLKSTVLKKKAVLHLIYNSRVAMFVFKLRNGLTNPIFFIAKQRLPVS